MKEANDCLAFLMMHAVQVARVDRYPNSESFAARPVPESRGNSLDVSALNFRRYTYYNLRKHFYWT